MTAYCVSYDLNSPNKDYAGLYEALKATTPQWWHYLDSTWLLYTNETANQVWNRLSKHLDRNDFLLVIEVRGSSQGWLPQEAWDWITQYVPNT